jgi:putative sigma-54 modulation protein
MNIAITFRQMEATEAVKQYATDKVAKLQKFLRRPMKSQVTLSCKDAGRSHCAEVDVHSGDHHFHAHDKSEDMYATIDKVIDKLERQITTQNEVGNNKKKGAERVSSHLLSDAVADSED